MRKHWKKELLCLLCVCAICVLGGCGNRTTETKNPQSETITGQTDELQSGNAGTKVVTPDDKKDDNRTESEDRAKDPEDLKGTKDPEDTDVREDSAADRVEETGDGHADDIAEDGRVNDVTDNGTGIGGAAKDLVDGVGDAGKELIDGVEDAGDALTES